ncbi:unnamed protein product [Heligmosomoides polygyrus]|uniref:DDE-1 domain-containing protein n=1 Tax=Heligmosomoides polygyrus TaxID=6339 RepID=A0A183GMT1_HELPZ|nr:unnamed protein product [Heligmosomoides polygyrus]
MKKIVRRKLKKFPYRLQKCQLLTDTMKKRKLERCKRLLQRFTVAHARDFVFTDQKIFTLNPVFNSQNMRIIEDSLADATAKGRLQERENEPQSVMVWGGVTPSGKTLLVFIEAGVKINAAICTDILEKVLNRGPTPALKEPTGAFSKIMLQHTAKVVQDWCDEQLPDSIIHDEWPSSSLDLNPMDYSV